MTSILGLPYPKLNIKQPVLTVKPSFQGNSRTKKAGIAGDTFQRSKIPEIKQLDMPGKEEYYCGPVSAANGIARLSRKFSGLYHSKNPYELADELARCFKTIPEAGTSSNNICRGLKSYLAKKGLKYKKLEYKGFRPVDKEFKRKEKPDLEWIKNNITGKSIVLLNLGTYKVDKSGDKSFYDRKYGHWVLATKQGHDDSSINPNCLGVLDPYIRKNGEHYKEFKPISNGELFYNEDEKENEEAYPVKLEGKGFYETSCMDSSYREVLDGAVVLEMDDLKNSSRNF